MGFTAQSRRSLLHVSALVSVLALATADLTSGTMAPVANMPVKEKIAASASDAMLTGIDKAHYRQAFMLQRMGRFAEADKELGLIGNPMLKATVLADRYLNKKYTPRYEELANWLAANNEAPASEEIYRLALTHKPAQAAALEEPAAAKSQRYNSGYARSALHDNKTWSAGLNAYRHNDMANAARNFRTLADGDAGLSQDDKAAASFWAYRSFKAQGDTAMAARYLDKTSDYPHGFYSLLARTLTGENTITLAPAKADAKELAALQDQIPVKRAAALKETGESALAENELRALYAKANKSTRATLLALAQQMDLSASQMRMAAIAADGKQAFPMPNWQPSSGYQVERALMFAFMRQESGFNPNARSASGAVGLMQLMPATAYAMAHENKQLGKSSDPSVNMTLGQRYLEHLMSTPHIGDNLIFLTAAYNAGPGAVANWLRNGHTEKDPLLFVESLPYAQTREYVTHVVANYWIYSQMMGMNNPSSLTAMASGDWPHYEGAERQLVAMLNRD